MTETELTYSPPLPWHRTRKVQRRVVSIVLVTVLIAATAWYSPRLWRRGKILHWQDKCLAYTAPADRVLYEEDLTAAAKLLAADARYRTVSGRSNLLARTPVCYVPDEYDGWRGQW